MISKIKNNIFLKSTLILLIGGASTRIIGFFLKIIITRKIGAEGMGIYSLLNPTISLLTTLAIFSYPTAVSANVSSNKSSSKNIIYSTIIFSLFLNFIFIIIIIFFSQYLSNNLLKEPRLYLPIICVSLTLPFVSISSIIKGYFWGKQNMFPYMISNFLEQITRMILICAFIDKFLYSISYTISFIIIVNIIGEIISEIIMVCFFPKLEIKIKDLKFRFKDIKKILSISIPSTSSKLIGSFSYFLEPIVLTNILLYMGYSKNYIVYEYGIINAYALSVLLMPQFLTQNMSTSLVPELSKFYSLGNYKLCKKRIKQIVLVSSFIGIICTLLIVIFSKDILNLLYNTTLGIDYIKLLAPFTILFYIEYPLISALQTLNKAKKAMKVTIIGSVVRLLSIVVFALLGFGMYSLIISIIINLIISTFLYRNLINLSLR